MATVSRTKFEGPAPAGPPQPTSNHRPPQDTPPPGKARSILDPLGLWESAILVHATAPRAPPRCPRRAVDVFDATAVALEGETHPCAMPDTRASRPGDHRHFDHTTSRASASMSAADCTMTLDDQLVFNLEDPDPWAHETEPVFWSD